MNKTAQSLLTFLNRQNVCPPIIIFKMGLFVRENNSSSIIMDVTFYCGKTNRKIESETVKGFRLVKLNDGHI